MTETGDEIAKLSERDPGADDEDPYEEVDISTLPEWWQDAIEEHRRYDLRPYRPPRFEDDVIYPRMKAEMQEELGADIMLVCYDIESREWDIIVDGEEVASVTRERLPEGYSLIEMTSEEFRTVIEEAA